MRNDVGPKSVMIAQRENECISLSVFSVTWAMTAQRENECISLSVFSVIWVMTAQWENECISLSVFSVAWVMIAQRENEYISMSVLCVAWVMIAERENECISPSVFSVARVQFPVDIFLADWQFRASVHGQSFLNGTIQPVGIRGGMLTSNHRQLMAEQNQQILS